jgi:orotidine-5'-phosphate decarboxylase
MTLNPYMGLDSVEPFIEDNKKHIFSLCLTSNSGSNDFQYLDVNGKPFYIRMMEKLVEWRNKGYKNIGAVVGATHPDELKELRAIAGDMIFLIPGIGSQGGDVEKVVKNSLISKGLGIINVSRKIIYASNGPDFADKARETAKNYRDMINAYI